MTAVRGASANALNGPAAFDLEAELARLRPEERSAASVFLATHAPGLGAPLAIVIPAYNE